MVAAILINYIKYFIFIDPPISEKFFLKKKHKKKVVNDSVEFFYWILYCFHVLYLPVYLKMQPKQANTKKQTNKSKIDANDGNNLV